MKTMTCLLLLFLSWGSVAQESDFQQIETTLLNYINGSSYNQLEQLESAFAEDATLYLTIRDEFKKLTPQEYVAFFKGAKGTFNGRIGNILVIDIFKDIATAKAEILIPSGNWRFIDLFLLKKTSEGWKIISKTATRSSTATESN